MKKKRLSREPILRRETLVVPSLNVLLLWDLLKTLRTLCFEKRPSFGNSGVCQPLCPSSRSVGERCLRRVWFLKISLRAKGILTQDGDHVFHKNTSARAIISFETEFGRCRLSWCDVLFLLFFFLVGCVGGQPLLQRLVKWLFAIAHGTLLFALLQSHLGVTCFVPDHVDTSHTAFAHTPH